jgi:hypothetical protein
MANEIRAPGLALIVRVSPPGTSERVDAIQVNIEHVESYCEEDFFPYRRSARGELTFGDLFAQPGNRSDFGE